jgi:hypothetical protein
MQDVLDEKLAAERGAVASLQAQAAAARAALEAEQALVSQLKEEASVSSAAAQQLMALEQQVRRCAVLCCAVQLLCVPSLAVIQTHCLCVHSSQMHVQLSCLLLSHQSGPLRSCPAVALPTTSFNRAVVCCGVLCVPGA